MQYKGAKCPRCDMIIIRVSSRISQLSSCLCMHPSESLVNVGSINDIQLTPQSTKYLLIKRFSEDICQLFVGANMLKVNVTFSNMISNEMAMNLNMLSSRMLHGIVCNINSTLIVT